VFRDAKFAVCVEPTSNAVELGCLGTMHAELTVRGKAAHAARPWLGVNAIHAALPLLQKVTARGERRWSPPGRPDIEYREVMSVTGMRGGKAKNVVPDECVMNLNFRFAPDRTAEGARAEVRALADGIAEVAFKDLAPAGRVASGNPWCDRLVALSGVARAKQAWTDVGRFTEMGLDAVSCGPGAPELAHQQAEHASIAKMVSSLHLFRAFIAGPVTK
jgi:succinyl-diaminopimelate desuccinylase